MNEFKILIVEDDLDMAGQCFKVFKRSGYDAAVCYSGKEALEMIAKDAMIRIVLTDLKMPGMDGIELLKRIKKKHPDIEVIIMTGYGTIRNAVQAIKIGATDYITKPFEKQEVLHAIEKITEAQKLKREVSKLRSELIGRHGFKNIIAKNRKMLEVLKLASFAAQSDCNVLILGESGTGKELIARAIHYNSPRSTGPFVPVNCGALPKELIESELFGHKKGAFTGANRDVAGLIRTADKGTIFLDEIAEMPADMQVKLLRVLQDKRVRPVGDMIEMPIDVRFISATNCSIGDALSEGMLRKDLYYRLSVVVIKIPPLRERANDIPILAGFFIDKFRKKFKKNINGIEQDALRILMRYNWPGNIRELENLIEGIFVVDIQGKIKASYIREILKKQETRKEIVVDDHGFTGSLSDVERAVIESALRKAGGNKSKAAAILGISRTRLYKKMETYNLVSPY